jgi:hypothetical protein
MNSILFFILILSSVIVVVICGTSVLLFAKNGKGGVVDPSPPAQIPPKVDNPKELYIPIVSLLFTLLFILALSLLFVCSKEKIIGSPDSLTKEDLDVFEEPKSEQELYQSIIESDQNTVQRLREQCIQKIKLVRDQVVNSLSSSVSSLPEFLKDKVTWESPVEADGKVALLISLLEARGRYDDGGDIIWEFPVIDPISSYISSGFDIRRVRLSDEFLESISANHDLDRLYRLQGFMEEVLEIVQYSSAEENLHF